MKFLTKGTGSYAVVDDDPFGLLMRSNLDKRLPLKSFFMFVDQNFDSLVGISNKVNEIQCVFGLFHYILREYGED